MLLLIVSCSAAKALAFPPPVLHPEALSGPTERKYQRVLLKQCGFNLRGVRPFKTTTQFLTQEDAVPPELQQNRGLFLFMNLFSPLPSHIPPSHFGCSDCWHTTAANRLPHCSMCWRMLEHRNSSNLDEAPFTLQA